MDTTDVSGLLRDWPAACQRALQDWGTTQKEVAQHSEAFRKRRVADNEVRQLLVNHNQCEINSSQLLRTPSVCCLILCSSSGAGCFHSEQQAV